MLTKGGGPVLIGIPCMPDPRGGGPGLAPYIELYVWFPAAGVGTEYTCCCIDPGPVADTGAENVSLTDNVPGEV